MSKKIIIAGGGHGGITCGAILAKNGFDVTVYEKNKADKMGHDWTDIFDPKAFAAVGMDMPPREMYNFKNNMTFFGPSMTTRLVQDVPEDELEIQMERRDIYKCIISYAEECGVKFEYGCEIKEPIMFGNRIVGIKTDKGDFLGDLVIDACGINSPLRSNLPKHLGIQNEAIEYERFYVYRAFFEKIDVGEIEDRFRVLMFHNGKLGISWVADDGEYTDVLIGRFNKLDMDEVEATLEDLRRDFPDLGEKKLRGGQFVEIPVRQPLGVLVADGYAAIGDSAFMTVPIIGSGIANSMKASAILAKTIIGDTTESYSAKTLWKYQREFYSKLGSGLAPLASIKLLLTRLEPADLDYIFATGILNADDMTISADSTSLFAMVKDMLDIEPLKAKIKGLAGRPDILKKVLRMIKDIAAVTAVTAAMPMKYDVVAVHKWAKAYNACFKH